MDNLIIILIIVIYGVYKIVNRICEHKEMMEEDDDSDIYFIIDKLIDENRELMERLLKKEAEDE